MNAPVSGSDLSSIYGFTVDDVKQAAAIGFDSCKPATKAAIKAGIESFTGSQEIAESSDQLADSCSQGLAETSKATTNFAVDTSVEIGHRSIDLWRWLKA